MESHRLPFADQPAIIVANNKDDEVSSLLADKLKELVALLGEKSYMTKLLRKLNWNTDVSIDMVSKFLYYLSTVYLGVRTPGQEFADINLASNLDTNPSWQKYAKRLIYILGHSGGVHFLQRLFTKLFKISETKMKVFGQAHLATFYLSSKYRFFWDRMLGMRYVLQHDFYDDEEKEYREKYHQQFKYVGRLILLKLAYDVVYPKISDLISEIKRKPSSDSKKINIPSTETQIIDLSDPLQLTYIPEHARSCILCSSEMVSPSSGKCGHVFCWTCLIEWCKSKKNCPLCRQACLPQEVIPLH